MSTWTKELDKLLIAIYDRLTELVNLSDKVAEEDYEIEKLRLVRLASQLLLEYLDLLKIFKESPLNDSQDLYGTYFSKIGFIKSRIRQIQLHLNGIEAEKIHSLRVQKFGKKLGLAKEREELFQGRAGHSNEGQAQSAEVQLLSKNKKITSKLQATKLLLSTSILQTELNIDTVDQQSQDLNQYNEKLYRFSDILSKSSQIVKFIEKQDKQDKFRIHMSIYFFIACCLWVIWRRFFRTPTKLLIWTFAKSLGVVKFITTLLSSENDSEGVIATSVLTTALAISLVATSFPGTSTSLYEIVIDINNQGSESNIIKENSAVNTGRVQTETLNNYISDIMTDSMTDGEVYVLEESHQIPIADQFWVDSSPEGILNHDENEDKKFKVTATDYPREHTVPITSIQFEDSGPSITSDNQELEQTSSATISESQNGASPAYVSPNRLEQFIGISDEKLSSLGKPHLKLREEEYQKDFSQESTSVENGDVFTINDEL